MRRLITTGAAVIAIAIALTGCSASTDAAGGTASTSSATSSPGAASSTASAAERTGTFEGLNGKKVSGTVTVTGNTITLAGFSSDEGPDLHVYLTNGTQESDVAKGTQVDAVRWNEAKQTFQLSGVDASSFSTVVIHCDKAKAVFGAAGLS